jgi:hypothetical protein
LRKLILDNSIEFNDESAIDELIEKIGSAKYVLLGEASHGLMNTILGKSAKK